MCEFASFVLTDDEKILAGDLSSHQGIEKGWSLSPTGYRECEWTRDDKGESLTVRTAPDDKHRPNWFKAVILSKFPTRKALLKAITIGKSNGDTFHFKNGKFHSIDDKPAFISANGDKKWWKDGKIHREGDKPAVVLDNGTKQWRKNGKRHREGDKPAVVYASGTKEWCKNGKLHREGDKPAIVLDNGIKCWFNNDKRHRAGDKPAAVYASGTKEWWKNGKFVKEEN